MNNIKNDAYSNRIFDNKEDKTASNNKLDERHKEDYTNRNSYVQSAKSDEFKQKDAENK